MNENIYFLTKTNEFRLKLYPSNFKKVKDFYENILNFPLLDSWGGETNGAMFNTGAGVIELLTPKQEYISVLGTAVSLGVDDVWKLWKEIKDKVKIVHAIRDNSWGDTSFRISDPEGFEITFFTKTNKPILN